MSSEITAIADHGDMGRLYRLMEQAERDLRKTPGEAIRWAAWSLARTLGTSTKVAKKSRPLKKVPGKPLRALGESTPSQVFEVTSWRSGQKKTFRIRSANVSTAKKDRRVRIGNRGMAKAAWMWGIKALGSGGSGMGFATGPAQRRAGAEMHVTKRLTGNDPYVRIENRLRYAQDAFKSSGPQTVDTAVRRAADMMEKVIRAKLYGSKFAK